MESAQNFSGQRDLLAEQRDHAQLGFRTRLHVVAGAGFLWSEEDDRKTLGQRHNGASDQLDTIFSSQLAAANQKVVRQLPAEDT